MKIEDSAVYVQSETALSSLTTVFGCYDRRKAYLGMELEKVAAGIKEEAMLLFFA